MTLFLTNVVVALIVDAFTTKDDDAAAPATMRQRLRPRRSEPPAPAGPGIQTHRDAAAAVARVAGLSRRATDALLDLVDKTYESLEARLAAAAGGGDTPSHLRSRSLRPRGSMTRGSSTSSATAAPGAGWAAARRVLAVARFRALGRVRSRSRDPHAPPPPPPPMPWRASSTASARSSLDSSVDHQMTPRLSHLNVDLDASVQAPLGAGSDPGRDADRSGGDARPSDGAPSTASLTSGSPSR